MYFEFRGEAEMKKKKKIMMMMMMMKSPFSVVRLMSQ
jgi:hypothetical protein